MADSKIGPDLVEVDEKLGELQKRLIEVDAERARIIESLNKVTNLKAFMLLLAEHPDLRERTAALCVKLGTPPGAAP